MTLAGLPGLVTQTVTVIRGGINGRTGQWTEINRFDVPGCLVDQTSSSELTGAGDQVQVNATVYAPYGTDVQPTDRVLFAGQTYDVVGTKADWLSPFTGEPLGTVVQLVRHTG